MEAVIEDKVSEVVENDTDVILKVEDEVSEVVENVTDVASKVEDKVSEVVENVTSKVEEKVNKVIEETVNPIAEMVENNQVIKKVVTVIDEKFAKRGCSFSLFGWMVSIHKSHQTDPTSLSK